MSGSHGDPELTPPPPGPINDEWDLYLAMRGPLEYGDCHCHAVCCDVCEDGTGCTCDPEKAENG
jgi:hypothetical protein